jgi:hypothetical protein
MTTSTGPTITTTPKTTALEVREDLSLMESPADPKLGPPLEPRAKPQVVEAKAKPLIGKTKPKV